VTPDEFWSELDDFCRMVDIERKEIGKHLYLLGVRLAPLEVSADALSGIAD